MNKYSNSNFAISFQPHIIHSPLLFHYISTPIYFYYSTLFVKATLRQAIYSLYSRKELRCLLLSIYPHVNSVLNIFYRYKLCALIF